MSDWMSHVAEWQNFERSLRYVNIPPSSIVNVWWEKTGHEWTVFLILREGQEEKRVEIDPPVLKSLVSFLVNRRFENKVSIKIPTEKYFAYDPVFSDAIRGVIRAAVMPPDDQEKDPGYTNLCTSPPVGLFSNDKIIAVVSAAYAIIYLANTLSKIPPATIESGGWKVESSYIHPDVAYLRVVNSHGISVCFINGYTGKTAAQVRMGITGEEGSWIDMLSSDTQKTQKTKTRIIHRGRGATVADEMFLDCFSPQTVQEMTVILQKLQELSLDHQTLQWIAEQISPDWREEFLGRVKPGYSALRAIQTVYKIGAKEGVGPTHVLGRLAIARRAGEIARDLIKMQDASSVLFLD